MKKEIKKAIIEAAKAHDPAGMVVKENDKSIVFTLPNHSYHSAVLDQAFHVAMQNGIKYTGTSHKPWVVKFSEK